MRVPRIILIKDSNGATPISFFAGGFEAHIPASPDDKALAPVVRAHLATLRKKKLMTRATLKTLVAFQVNGREFVALRDRKPPKLRRNAQLPRPRTAADVLAL